MASVLFTYPLELIRVRMAYHTRSTASGCSSKTSFLRAAAEIYHESPATKHSIFMTPSPSSKVSSASPLLTAPLSTCAATPTSLFSRFPLLKFYRGFSVTLAGMIPYAGTSFLAWGVLRECLLSPSPDGLHKHRPKTVVDLAIGAVAGAVAQTVSYPFEVVRRRMQVGGVVGDGHRALLEPAV